MGRATIVDAEAYIAALERVAVREVGSTPEIARRAGQATVRAVGAGHYDVRRQERARAYFWTVVRRSVAKDPASRDARARFLLAAVVADLKESGRTPDSIWETVERGWGQRIPDHVLLECKARLCA